MEKYNDENFLKYAKGYDMLSYHTLSNINFARILQALKNHQDEKYKNRNGITIKIDDEHYKIMSE